MTIVFQKRSLVLTSFSLSNFKGFKMIEPINLKPLTVLCGTNNSGKSSIIQSLLLMKQSNIDTAKVPINNYVQEPIAFNGLYVRLGDWTDVIYNHDIEGEISFYWQSLGEIKDSRRSRNYLINSNFNVTIKALNSENLKNRLFISKFIYRDSISNFSFELNKSGKETYSLKLKNISLRDLLFTWIYSYNSFDYYFYKRYYRADLEELVKKFNETKFFKEKVINEVNLNNVQVKFEGIFPTVLIIKNFPKQSFKSLNKVKEELTSNSKKVPKYLAQFIDNLLNSLRNYTTKEPSLEKNLYEGLLESSSKKDFSLFSISKEKEFVLIRNYYSYQLTVTQMRNLWSGFRYIGPLREEPKRFYLFDDLRKIDIGIKGEYTALVLTVEQEQKLPKYYRCIYDGKRIKEYELRESDKMLEAINWWLSECMKLPEINSVPDLRGVINQIKLNSSGVEVYLPDVGFGISQILPILVECLRTKEEETIVLEQPEIHLHPSIQSKLADFLICMAKSGKKLVVETHSEHLINRLCLRIAQEEDGEVKALLNTVFVSFDEQQQSSVVRPIIINEFGEIENWPVGFFDENDSRDLMAATLKKRMSKSKI